METTYRFKTEYTVREWITEDVVQELWDCHHEDMDTFKYVDEMQDHLWQIIDNAVIYYHDCWNICKILNPCGDLENPLTGEQARSITELAFAYLLEYAEDVLHSINS